MDKNYFDYIIKTNVPSKDSADSTSQTKRIKVIDKTKNVKEKDRLNLIKQVFEKNQNLEKITITNWDSNTKEVTYSVDNAESKKIIKIDSDTLPAIEVRLAIKQESDISPKTSLNAFAKSYQKLFLEHKEANIFLVFWWLLVLPILALRDSCRSIEEKANRPLDRLWPSGPDAFFETLSTTHKILAKEAAAENSASVTKIQDGINYGKRLVQSANSSDVRESLKKDIDAALSQTDSKKTILLPAGYYTQNDYQPVLLSLYKSGDQIHIQKISLANPDPEHTGKINPVQEFELSEDQFSAFFTQLSALQQAPTTMSLSKEEEKQRLALSTSKETLKLHETSDPLSAILGAPLSTSKSPSEPQSATDDPWKLIFTWINKSDPELMPDKVTFMTHVTNTLSSHFLKYYNYLSVDQQQLYLSQLDKRFERLSKKLEKKDPELASAILGPLKSKIQKMAQESAASLLKQREKAKMQALSQPLPPAQLQLKWQKHLSSPITSSTEETSVSKNDVPGIASKGEDIKALTKLFQTNDSETIAPLTQEEAATALKHLSTLHTKVEELINSEDYREARLGATLVLSCLPRIDHPEIWKEWSVEQMDQLSRLIEQTSGQLSEAKLRLGEDHLWPSELVHLYNGKAIILKLIRERYQRLSDQVYEKYDQSQQPWGQKPATKQAWQAFFDTKPLGQVIQLLKDLNISKEYADAICFRDYTVESTQICHLLENDPYLHFGEDPLLQEKATALLKFYQEDRKLHQKERSAVLFNAFDNDQLYQPTVSVLNNLSALHETDFNAAEATNEIERSSDPSRPQQLPSFLIDLRRLEAWGDTLINPKRSLWLNFTGTRGITEAIGWASKNKALAEEGANDKAEILSRLRDLQYRDIRQRLKKMGRLTLKIDTTILIDKKPAVQIVSKTPSSSSGFCLSPRQPPGKLSALDIPEDPHVFQAVLGMMPEMLATAQTSFENELDQPSQKTQKTSYVVQKPAELFLNTLDSSELNELDPMDRYRLNALNSEKPYFTSFKVWNLIDSSPHLLENPTICNHLIHLLFKNEALKTQVSLTPERFSRTLKGLKTQIAQSLEKGELEKAATLSYLARHLTREIDTAISFWERIGKKDEKALNQLFLWESKNGFTGIPQDNPLEGALEDYYKEAIERSTRQLKELKSLETQDLKTNIDKENTQLLEAFRDPNTSADLKTLSLFLLIDLKQDQILEMEGKDISSVLNAWRILLSSQNDVAMPYLKDLILLKMNREILPALLEKMSSDKGFRKNVLNSWVGTESDKWEVSSENPGQFVIKNQQAIEATADLIKCEISSPLKTTTREKIRYPLPSEITNHPVYSQLFGTEVFSATMTPVEGNPSKQEFKFELNQRKFTLSFDRKKKELVVFQVLGKQRFYYTEVSASNEANFAKTIQHYGIWVNEKETKQALLLPGKMQDWKDLDAVAKAMFILNLDSQGNVEQITNYKKENVVQDSTRLLTPFFPFVDEADLIFLSGREDRKIERIVLLKEKMEFEVVNETEIRLLDKEKGWTIPFVHTQRLIDLFGPSYEQFMIPLVKDEEVELRLFPNAILPTRLRGETGILLDYEKSAPWENSFPSLTVKIDAERKMHGSHAAFLYLAYAAFSQGEIQRAVTYLQEASRADRIDPKEVPVIQFISSLLAQQPHPTDKSIAFQLKAALTIRQILRESYHVAEFNISNWDAHLKEIERLGILHREYSKKEDGVRSPSLALTSQEKAEFERFKKESIQTLVQKEEERSHTPKSESIQLSRPNHLNESPHFLSHLILLMEPAQAISKDDLLSKGLRATSETVLKHFWTYWTLIAKGQLKKDDLLTFMLPIPHIKGSDPALLESVDFARRLLFTFALYQDQLPKITVEKEKTLSELSEKLNACKAELDPLLEDIQKIESEIELLENELKKTTTQEEKATLEQQLATQGANFKETQRKIDEHEIRRSNLTGLIFSTESEIDRLKNPQDFFLPPDPSTFALKKSLAPEQIKLLKTTGFDLNAIINLLFQQPKLAKHQESLQRLVSACSAPIQEMLQGKRDQDGELMIPGATQLKGLPKELMISSDSNPVETELKLSLKEFGEQLQSADLSQEERELYTQAIRLVQSSQEDEKHTLPDVLKLLLTEGKLPLVASQRYKALRDTITEKERQALSSTPFPETEILIKPKGASEFDPLFSSDFDMPSQVQINRLIEVFEQNPQYHAEFSSRYEEIYKSQPEDDGALNGINKPTQLNRSKDVAQFLLYAAATIRKSELGADPDREVEKDGDLPAIPTIPPRPVSDQLKDLRALAKSYEKHLKQTQITFVEHKHKQALATFESIPSRVSEADKPMFEHENERFQLGLEDARKKKLELIDHQKGVINPREVEPLQQQLKKDISQLQNRLKTKETLLIQQFKPLAKQFGLETLFRHPEKAFRNELINTMLDLCEDGKLSTEIEDKKVREELLTTLAQYLFEATELQQKEKALEEASKLSPLAAKRKSLQSQIRKASSLQLQDQINEVEIEWKELSASIESKLKAGENHLRFSKDEYSKNVSKVLKAKIKSFSRDKKKIDSQISHAIPPQKEQLEKDSKEIEQLINELTDRKTQLKNQTGDVIDQEQTLPFLVREFRQKIIFTQAQIEKIETILDDPNALEEFRMGLGKSSVIFPCVARILINRGKFPIVLFTEELLEQSRKDMDKKAYYFQFQRNAPIAPEELAEEYHTLLSVKHSKRYVIATVERIAALENKIIELNKILKGTWEEYQKDEGQEKLFQQMNTLMEQLFWLEKIASIMDAPETRIVADEIDEIFNIASEKNYSDGVLEDIDRIAFDSGERIFQQIIQSKSPVLETFKEALIQDKLANYSKEEVQKAMNILAGEIYDSETFWKSIGWTEPKPDRKKFAKYLSNLECEKLPEGMPTWSSDLKDQVQIQKLSAIGALRHWMTKTIPTLAEKQNGKDYGFGPEGYTVVPRKEQRDKPNTKFGQEAELIGYHFLSYIRGGENPKLDAFIKGQIADIQNRALKETESKPWGNWLQTLNGNGDINPDQILKTLKQEDKISERMQFLRFIMQESPRIQVYHSQIARNVQDTILGRKVAGASGTMSRYPLPTQFSYDRSNDARSGTGDTLLRLALMNEGFEEKVTSYTDLMTQMSQLVLDPNCKAIINQGYATPNRTTYGVIEQFRRFEEKQKTPTAKRCQYVFIHPEYKRPYLWLPEHNQPEPFDKDLDARKIDSQRVKYYFSPADTRGTDFKIPYGYGALFTGPTTTPDEFDQAIWRLRALGAGQTCKLFIEETHAKRIKTDGSSVLLKDLIADIEFNGVKTSATSNLKAATFRPEAILRQEVKKALFTPEGQADRFTKAKMAPKPPTEVLKEIEENVQAFTAVESLFVRSKELNFRLDYTPSKMEDIIPHLEAKYTETLDKTIGSSETQGILKQLPSSPKKQTRVDQLHSKVELSKQLISDEKEQLQSKQDEHTKFLPSRVSSVEAGEKDAQAEVQEQQQQQQQQQTQTFQEKSQRGEGETWALQNRGSASIYHQPFSVEGYMRPDTANAPLSNIYSMAEIDEGFKDCGIGVEYPIHLTQSMKEWMKVCPPNGKSVHYLAIYQYSGSPTNHHPSDWVATWLTDLDAEFLIAQITSNPALEARGCFSILTIPETPDKPIAITFNPIGEKNYDELMVAISKLCMGFTAYPEGEREKLFNWFKKLSDQERKNWIAILDQKQAPKSLIEMLKRWDSATHYTPASKPSKVEPKAFTPQTSTTSSSQPRPKLEKPKPPQALKPQITPSNRPLKDHSSVGGLGKCADYSMKDQLDQLNKKCALKDLRQAAAKYLEEHSKELAKDEVWIGQITTALKDAWDFSMSGKIYDNTASDQEAKKEEIDNANSEELVLAYAKYIEKENTWWDVAAFRALAANPIFEGMQIAVLQDAPSGSTAKYFVDSQYPSEERLNPDQCLFIWYNQTQNAQGNHYHSFNRESPTLKDSIKNYQETFLHNFMEKAAATADVKELEKSIQEFSTHDPLSYHAMCELIWEYDNKRNDSQISPSYIYHAETVIKALLLRDKLEIGDFGAKLLQEKNITLDLIRERSKSFQLKNGEVKKITSSLESGVE